MDHRKYLVLLMALTLTVTLPGLAAGANLVVNGDFETGDFTGWTTEAAPSGSLFGVSSTDPHSGSYAAYFGGVTAGNYDVIYQLLSTNPGTQYVEDYWLANPYGGTPSDFLAWNPDIPGWVDVANNPSAFGYTNYSFDFTGTGADYVAFAAYQVPSFFYLDDVSVTAVPEPATMLLLGSGLIGLAGLRIKKFLKK